MGVVTLVSELHGVGILVSFCRVDVRQCCCIAAAACTLEPMMHVQLAACSNISSGDQEVTNGASACLFVRDNGGKAAFE